MATIRRAGTGTTEKKRSTATRARGKSTMNAPVTADTAPLAPTSGTPLMAIWQSPATMPPVR